LTTIRGRVWKLGDHINTDLITPGKYLKLTYEEMADYVLEGVDPALAKKIKPGDIVVAGKNFGCGSSRESAPAALKCAGISAVVADFFARIFFRNAINLGLHVVECPQIGDVSEGDELEIFFESGLVMNHTKNKEYKARGLPPHVLEMLKAGGLIPYLAQGLTEK